MARWKTARGKPKAKRSNSGLVGCVLFVALMIVFVTWVFFAVLNPK